MNMTRLRVNALPLAGATDTAAVATTNQLGAAFHLAQLNHSEYAYPFAILMLYISYKKASKDESLTPVSQRWSRVAMASCMLFVAGVVLQGTGKQPHPLRVLG